MESDMERSPTDIGSLLRTLASADDEKALNLVRQQLSTAVPLHCVVRTRMHILVLAVPLCCLNSFS